MLIKTIVKEDFNNYKKPAMVIGFPKCSFKCEKESGKQVCQNSALATAPDKTVSIDSIIEKYMDNKLTKAIVLGGLEPFDSKKDLIEFVNAFRLYSDDDIVIYTGYYKEEIKEWVDILSRYPNIIIKFGRFIPNQKKHYDEVLGVELASDNQYAERIS